MEHIPERLAKRFVNSAENGLIKFNQKSATVGKVDLSLGKPDFPPNLLVPNFLAEVALEDNKHHQYTREQGHPRLVEAIAELHGPLLNRKLDAMEEIIVTHGGLEELSLAITSLVNPDEEIILIEPFYSFYLSMARVAEAKPVFVPLRATVDVPQTSSSWCLDPIELESKFNLKTKVIVLNNPVNPLGKVFTREELEKIASLCIKYDVVCIADEVYEWHVYDGKKHIRIATLPGMWERTITLSSVSKSLGVTGWRVGWSIGPKDLVNCLLLAHLNGDCVVATPTQEAVARCLERELCVMGQEKSLFTIQRNKLQAKRDELVRMLKDVGFHPCVPEAGYYVMADWTCLNIGASFERNGKFMLDENFSLWLTEKCNVVCVPASNFYLDHKSLAAKYVRFCFLRSEEVLRQAYSCFAVLGRGQ